MLSHRKNIPLRSVGGKISVEKRSGYRSGKVLGRPRLSYAGLRLRQSSPFCACRLSSVPGKDLPRR